MGKLNNGLKFLLGIALYFVIGSIAFNAIGLSEYSAIGGGVFAAMSLVPMDLSGTLASTPTLTALAAYGGKYEKKIFSELRNSLDILNDTTVIPGIKNKLNLTKLTVGDGVRAYREAFDDNDGDLNYTPRVIETSLLKRDIKINPLKYRETWMSELMKPGVNPQDLPFAQYVYSEISKKVGQEINDNIYLATKGAGTNVATSLDGLGTIIAKEITDGNIIPVATGAATATNAVSKAEMMMKSMPVAYRNNGFDITCSFAFWDLYQEDYREKYGKYIEPNKDGYFFIDSTRRKVKINPVTWLGSSGRLMASPIQNIITGVDAVGDFDKLHIETKFELLEIRMLFAIGSQIRDLSALKVNDQS
ncbi:hypothetical protein ACR777_15150 [Sphingobacterium spiritivorum]|uniref:hypothetical protein n=1 Tax=Sphingobacterium spiritivorum TaxID=258 RepID=UPI003DA5CC64